MRIMIEVDETAGSSTTHFETTNGATAQTVNGGAPSPTLLASIDALSQASKPQRANEVKIDAGGAPDWLVSTLQSKQSEVTGVTEAGNAGAAPS